MVMNVSFGYDNSSNQQFLSESNPDNASATTPQSDTTQQSSTDKSASTNVNNKKSEIDNFFDKSSFNDFAKQPTEKPFVIPSGKTQ